MSAYVPWNSQPLDEWARQHAPGRFVELDGHKTHYVEMGEGEPLLLLHGFNMDGYTWINNLEALAQDFKVYVPDLWGEGYSTRQPLDYGFPLYAEQVRLFMDHFGLAAASLVGHSMGGGSAIQFCARHPQRVRKLVLVDSNAIPHPMPLTGKVFRLPGVGEFLLRQNTDFFRKKNMRDFWIHDPELLTDEYFQDATRFQKARGSSEALLDMLRRGFTFYVSLEDELRRIAAAEVPALIVWGREDKAVPLHCGEEIHRLLPGSRLEIIEGAGHMPNHEKPEAFNRLVRAFLREG